MFSRSSGGPITSVIVIGHDGWQKRFGGDPAIVGRAVGLGRVQTVVVGVMPEGFAFPVAHSLWATDRGAQSRMSPEPFGPSEEVAAPAVAV